MADFFKIVLKGRRIRELVDHVCTGLVLSCPDKDHPAVRYGQMLRMLSKRLEELHDASVSHNQSGQNCVFTPFRRRFRPVIPLLSPSKRLPTPMHLHKQATTSHLFSLGQHLPTLRLRIVLLLPLFNFRLSLTCLS